MLLNTDEKIKDTITQYYNIIQGNLKSAQVFVRATEFNADVRRVQKSKLMIPEEQILLNDPIPQRREIREIYEKIYTRLPKVAEAEKEKAKTLLAELKQYIEYDEIDDDDIEELISTIKSFYSTANTALINIHGNMELVDSIRKEAKTISVAIAEAVKGIKCDDSVDVLMMFSKDPLAKIERLLSMLSMVQKDIDYVAKDVAKRRDNISVDVGVDVETKYLESKTRLHEASKIVADWRVRGC